MSALFIEDGHTKTKTVEAAAGLHPEVRAVYRPALARVRSELGSAFAASPEKGHDAENRVLAAHVVSLNGESLTAATAARLVPALRARVLELVMGYAGGDDEAADLKN